MRPRVQPARSRVSDCEVLDGRLKMPSHYSYWDIPGRGGHTPEYSVGLITDIEVGERFQIK